MKKHISILSFVFALIAAATASAAPPQPANLRVLLEAPTTAAVYSPYQYTVRVKNIGGQSAAGVVTTVNFPETDTSPTKYILGTLSGINANGNTCQTVNRTLRCTMGSIGPNVEKTFTFNFALPVSTKVLEVKGTATTTTANEQNQANNWEARVPGLLYGSNTITSANVLITMCTGRNLSSFFECELFPSSQQSHIFTLNSDMSVSAYGQAVGTWDQPSPSQIHLYMVNGGTVIEHNGYARDNTCFEGRTTFTPSPSGYMSQYKICVQ